MENTWESSRLQHDASFAIARQLVACVEGCLRPEERADCFAAFYDIVRAGVADYEAQCQRQLRRLHGLAGRN